MPTAESLPKIAAAYIRVSTDDQVEYSPDAQLVEIRKYAAAHGYERVGVVSHGGALMALRAKYGRPERDYYGWMCPNCGGFRAELNPDTLELTILEEYRGEKGL